MGFVNYTNHEDALSAMETLQGKKAHAEAPNTFKIKFANKQRPRRKATKRGRGILTRHRFYQHGNASIPSHGIMKLDANGRSGMDKLTTKGWTLFRRKKNGKENKK